MPSQELSTSPDVSVRAEVEDHPLLGTRKLWLSQLSHPFEMSASDMEVDSPRFSKKALDGDDDDGLVDEDLPILETQKPGSSQIFNSAEISSLDMKVDSSRFFIYSFDNSGDDNKSSKYHYRSEASTWMASLDDNNDAKSDLFEDSTQANLKSLEEKFVHTGSEFHIQAPSDDEVYSMSNAILPMPTCQRKRLAKVLPSQQFTPHRSNNPASDSTTSSDVSVKLEVKDLPLFEDAKPGPSHLFGSFEISMQVDSPRSKKTIDNGDGPDKCHDSSEVGIWMALLLWMSLMTVVTFRMTMIWVTKDTLYSEIEKLGLCNFSRNPHFRT